MLSQEVIQTAQRSVLCWLATADASGQPNVSPKEIFAVLDERRIIIANVASPGSARNINQNARVCVSFVDVFVQKGFKVFGTARNVTKTEAEFAAVSGPLQQKAGPRFPVHSVFLIEARSVEAIVAPSYRLFPESTSEQSQVEAAMRTYGVRPLET